MHFIGMAKAEEAAAGGGVPLPPASTGRSAGATLLN
jgi:hypothetical protein